MTFDNFKKLLTQFNIPNDVSVINQLLVSDNKAIFNFIVKKKTINQLGGEKINYKYNNYNFIINIDDDAIKIQRNDDINDPLYCLFITIDKITKIAYINTINYDPKCVNSGQLHHPGGGSILFEMAKQFLSENKNKLNIAKIQLSDKSSLYCNEAKNTIPLSAIYMLSKGDTWYGKHKFLPYNPNTDTLDEKQYIEYQVCSSIVKTIKINCTNIPQYLKGAVIKYNKKMSTYNELMEKYGKSTINEFFTILLTKFDNTCVLFYEIYEKVMKELQLSSFYGKSYFYLL